MHQRDPSRTVVALLLLLIALGLLTRLAGPPLSTYSPLWAIAVVAGARIGDRTVATLLPLIVLALTDLWLGLHGLIWVVYACFAATVWGAHVLRQQSYAWLAAAAFGSTIGFYLVTNFAVWTIGGSGSGLAFDPYYYPPTLAGLGQSYWMGLPFLRDGLIGTALYLPVLLYCADVIVPRHVARVHAH